MNAAKILRWLAVGSVAMAAALMSPRAASAHCDGMDGPVVKAAQKALATGNVNLVLIWVQPDDEAAIKTAFRKTLAVRKLGPEARDLADTYFFETLVRIHRAGEGAPYTGLQPAGRDLGPVIPAADKAVAEGNVEPLLELLPAAARPDIRKLFEEVLDRKNFQEDNVRAGRAYVEAYVAFMHAAEGHREGGHAEAADHDHPAGAAQGHHDTEVRQHESPASRQHAAPGCPLHGGAKEVHRDTHRHPGP